MPEIRAFAEHNHYNILHPILRYVSFLRCSLLLIWPLSSLLARGMELPEETFVDFHGYDHKGEGWSAYINTS